MGNLEQVQYSDVRNQMQPGDVIAFSGKSGFSDIIKSVTRAQVSHVGIIQQTKMLLGGETDDRMFNLIAESTRLDDFAGVQTSRLSKRVEHCKGEMWWMPLSDTVRNQIDFVEFYNWLSQQDGKAYDLAQAIQSAIDLTDDVPFIGGLTKAVEDTDGFFCSELVAAALEHVGAVDELNSSEVTPIDLCRFDIYSGTYYQMVGDPKNIGGYNSLPPGGWGM